MEESQALRSDTIFHKQRLCNREAVHVGTARGRPPNARRLRGAVAFLCPGLPFKQGEKASQVSASAARSLTLSSGLNLRRNHARMDMHDQRPCQRISRLPAPVHTAGGQSGSNASACLRRFSLCFTLPGLVKHARAASCWSLRDAVRIMKCVNCFFSCREMVRNWLCRSV